MAAAAQPEYIRPGEYEEDGQEVVTDSTLSVYEEAERNSQVFIAKKYPRSMTFFRRDLAEIARMSQPVAMEMMYSVPRAGKQLIGPSVRFAEATLSCWGNCQAAVRIKDVSGDFIIAEGAFYDAERNARITVEVKRRITDKDGKRFGTDMIGVTGAAASSIALRGAILRGVPKALWADIFEQAKLTAAGKVESMDKTRAEKVALFRALGVTDAMLLNALQIPGIADIGADEIVAMATWHKQLTNKESSLEDIFGSVDDAEVASLMDALGWNEAKRTMANQNYKGRLSELLDHLRGEAKQANAATGGKPTAVPKKATPKEPVASDPSTGSTETASTTTVSPEEKTSSPTMDSPFAKPAATKPAAKASEDW